MNNCRSITLSFVRARPVVLAVSLLALCSAAWISPVYAQLQVKIKPLHKSDPAIDGAAVYLIPSQPLEEKNTPLAAVEMIQQNQQFSPYISVIETGTTVYFPNKDPIAHHVYSFSQPQPFELALYKGGQQEPSVTFNQPGLLAIGCNIHDWMLGYILVVDTPYFATVNELTASFDSVPVGDYRLHLWHPGLHRKERIDISVTVTGQPQIINISLQYRLRSRQQPTAPNDAFDESDDFYE